MKLDGDCSKEQSLALYDILPQERKDSVDKVKREGIKKKRLYTGAFLQYMLSKETGIPVEQLHYKYNQWGKPELDVERILKSSEILGWNGDLKQPDEWKEKIRTVHFNLSHSGDYVVLAISDSPVGVDVEYKTKGYEALVKRCFCETECEDIMSLDTEEERKKCFLEYWTMKEAYIKCVGEGMRIPLNSFLIQRDVKIGAVCMSKATVGALNFGTFFIEREYCVSVCSSSSKDVVRFGMDREIVKEVKLHDLSA
ncbi:MAG: 4'-phosphopantetheinyl transferase superfamily protein [Lachnospiraceae bacterium]|nr:4'-phosphopantetheinyl transferase superfamily protein [Lachnospiraceae bacterium]